jgi:hypothetical protein
MCAKRRINSSSAEPRASSRNRLTADSTGQAGLSSAAPISPSQIFPQTEQASFYTHYFSQPGQAERDVAATLRKLYFRASGDAGPRDIIGDMRKLVPNLRDSQIIPRAGHWLQQEAPDLVNAAVIEFLRNLQESSVVRRPDLFRRKPIAPDKHPGASKPPMPTQQRPAGISPNRPSSPTQRQSTRRRSTNGINPHQKNPNASA